MYKFKNFIQKQHPNGMNFYTTSAENRPLFGHFISQIPVLEGFKFTNVGHVFGRKQTAQDLNGALKN